MEYFVVKSFVVEAFFVEFLGVESLLWNLCCGIVVVEFV